MDEKKNKLLLTKGCAAIWMILGLCEFVLFIEIISVDKAIEIDVVIQIIACVVIAFLLYKNLRKTIVSIGFVLFVISRIIRICDNAKEQYYNEMVLGKYSTDTFLFYKMIPDLVAGLAFVLAVVFVVWFFGVDEKKKLIVKKIWFLPAVIYALFAPLRMFFNNYGFEWFFGMPNFLIRLLIILGILGVMEWLAHYPEEIEKSA